jgi:integrase/recombinase XerD
MDNTNDLVFKFKEHLAVLNRSPATIKSYTDHLKGFLAAIKETDMKKVTRSMIESYISELYDYRTIEGKPYSIGTICIKVRSVKRFFEFLEKANIIFIDPAETIKEPQKEKNLPKRVLTRKEVLTIMDQPNLGTRTGIRDRAILELFDSTGIRKEELCALSIYDADLTGRMLRVKGKGKKDRVVPMGRHAAKFLKEYIAKVRPHYTKKNRSSRHLLVDIYGKPISKQAVSAMVKKYGKSAGIKKSVSPHIFRHGFASVLIKNGADLMAVQKMLGHAFPSTTQIYIRSLGLDIKSVHSKTHPREKDKADRKTIKPRIERIRPQHGHR